MEQLHRPSPARQRTLMPFPLTALILLGLQATAGWAEPAESTATAIPNQAILRPAAAQQDAAGVRPTSGAAAPVQPASSQAGPKIKAMADDKPPRQKARTPAKRTEQNKRRQQGLAKQAGEERPIIDSGEERQRLTAARIQQLLAQAKRDSDAGRLLEPPRNNAAEAYREVLALDPSQLEALVGAKRIIRIVAAEAERTAAAGDRGRTQKYIAAIRALQPNDPSLPELAARLRAMQESPVVLSVRRQERYGRSAESIERAYEALQSQPLDQRAIDAAMSEYARAESLVAQAPGLDMLKDRIIVAFPAATRTELARDDSRRALKVVAAARERGWLTPELEMLEKNAQSQVGSRRQGEGRK
jgi:hypothetical protein